MTVALDALSVGVTTPGPNNHMGKWGDNFSGGSGVPFSGFITPGASATLCLVLIAADSTTPGTWTVSIGSSVMTQIGTQLNIGTQSITLFGLLNPPSGSQSLTVKATGLTGNTIVYGGATFTGTSTVSLAAATGLTTGTGTSSTAAVATSDSVPSGDMALYSCGVANATGISSTTGTTIDTLAGFGAFEYGMAYYSGAGSAVTGSATLSGSMAWSGAIIHIYAPASAVKPTRTMMGAGV